MDADNYNINNYMKFNSKQKSQTQPNNQPYHNHQYPQPYNININININIKIDNNNNNTQPIAYPYTPIWPQPQQPTHYHNTYNYQNTQHTTNTGMAIKTISYTIISLDILYILIAIKSHFILHLHVCYLPITMLVQMSVLAIMLYRYIKYNNNTIGYHNHNTYLNYTRRVFYIFNIIYAILYSAGCIYLIVYSNFGGSKCLDAFDYAAFVVISIFVMLVRAGLHYYTKQTKIQNIQIQIEQNIHQQLYNRCNTQNTK